MLQRLLPLLACVALTSCIRVETPERTGPLYFELEFTSTPQGLDEASPGDFSIDPVSYPLRVQAIGYDREPLDWDGTVQLHVSPGQLSGSGQVLVSGGVGQTTAQVALGFDVLRLWVSDEGSDEEPGSFASGVAPAIYLDLPTISELQTPVSSSDDASVLSHAYVPIQGFAAGRELLVTTVTNDGFYVTDFSDSPGTYNSLFVFTFSRPDGVEPGARLNHLAGIVAEYIGYTEMQFPTYEVESLGHSVGEPNLLDPTIVCDDQLMEPWEASVVRVENIASDFQAGSECTDYNDYGQWPALLDGTCGGSPARVSIVNINTVPSFDFPECELNQPPPVVELYYLVGTLRHTAPADPPWIIDVRSCLDLPEEHRPEDCASLLERPLSGPRKAPHAHYRDIDTCEGVPYRLQPRP